MSDYNERIALTEGVFYILISLKEPLHGYGIMQNVEKLSNGRVSLGPGTLYGALNSLLDKKWITAWGNTVNSRKKEYVITDTGIEVIKNELSRLEELIQNGRIFLGGII
ncbi:PadR family transcriptional regulator [Anaeromicropila populeti]|uniref:Transcriptional regulator PadR-like family protein n=1 Tax=Anaeromicropila populeti TaxID=37658 RepID=A0A1I6HUE9_9FIRM|nr:helix-turn-helix transcriptional regulator [Anaeromicropila populeti]SFR58059.1 Transcriptional regulator PadR-like family protein [Anaeromicropila populeti]